MDETQFTCSINELPDEILECIFALTSPYRDFKSMMLVCHRWHNIVTGVISRHFQQFQKAVSTGNLAWSWHEPAIGGPTVTERYSHSACYYDRALYVFGGCTSTATTFNDLWKFDLVEGRWFRPLATGSYPSPKAWATMVAYKDSLVLFGGWSYPTPITFHQASRFFNQLHLYHPGVNHWTQVTSQNCPEGKAGHGASIIGDSMVVFGGSHGFENSCNDILVLDLKEMTWRKQPTGDNKPRPRYSHSQVIIDEQHILIFGGCGGANMQFSDAWLLTLNIRGGGIWTWQELSIANPDLSAPQLWCHPACKVGDKLVILSKNPKVFKWDVSQALATQPARPASRRNIPPHQLRIPGKNKTNQLGSQANSKRPESQGTPSTSTRHESNERDSSSSSERMDSSRQESASEASSSRAETTSPCPASLSSSPSSSNQPLPGASSATPTASSSAATPTASVSPSTSTSLSPSVRSGMPCVRPNAMKNRQHQLETLKKYEQKFRAAAHQSNPSTPSPHSMQLPSPSADLALRRSSLNPICIHTVDLGHILSDNTISWLPIQKPDCVISPEETIFYSLVEGRGELIMFGGIRGDLHTMQRGLQLKTQAVSNTIHYLSFSQHID